MERWHVVLLLVVGLVLLMLSVYLRARFGEKFELRTVDLVLIILPLIFALLVTGKLKMLDAFGIKADFSELFAEAAGQTIENQVDEKQSRDIDELVQAHSLETKGGVSEIPRLIENKIEALLFRLGHGGYYGPAIKQYLDQLIAGSYLQYVVITESDGTLYGIFKAKALYQYLLSREADVYETFASWLNRADREAREKLAELPGFIGIKQAIQRDWSKREALKRMDTMRVDSLPVVDQRNYFVGTVDRSQLTASLILDVVNRMEKSTSS